MDLNQYVQASADYICRELVEGMRLSRSDDAREAANGKLIVAELVTLLTSMASAKEPQ
jgi:hypothetical protein